MDGRPRSTRSRRNDDQPLEQRIAFRISRLSQLLGGWAERAYGHRFGLSLRQWRVLATLARFGELSANEVAARTALDKSQVSRAVTELLARNLLRQGTDRADRRRTLLRLTTKGTGLVRRVAPLSRLREERLGSCLTRQELAHFVHCLERLTAAAQRMIAEDRRHD